MSDTAALELLCTLITERLGIGPQNLRREKLEAALVALAGKRDLRAIVDELRNLDFRTDAWQAVIAAATIPETRFLRQSGWFRQLEIHGLASLIELRRQQGDRRLRLWSAGCASGEEAYTLALLISNLLPDLGDWQIEIVATDICAQVLRDADRGVYAMRQLRELAPVQITRHFMPSAAGRHAVSPELRRLVRFQIANLAEDSLAPAAVGTFDLIICRNVLIYLTPVVQRRVAAHLCASLRQDGWLAVGPAEAIADWFRPLVPVCAPEAIFFHKRQVRPTVAPPATATRARPITVTSAQLMTGIETGTTRPVPPSLEEVRGLADRGALQDARQRCTALLAADGLNGDAHLLLSVICSELGDYPSAHDAIRRAIYLQPSSAQAHFHLAGVLRHLGQNRRADRTLAIASDLAGAEASRAAALEHGAHE